MITEQGRILADRHRVAQGRIAATTVALMLRLWPSLVAGGRVEENASRWFELVMAALTAQRAQSAGLAAQFSLAYRAIEGGLLDDFTPVPAVELNREALATSLAVTGPVAYRREVARQLGVDSRDVTPRDLLDTRLPRALEQKIAANQARAATRHVQNGARETLDDVMQRDSGVIGYVRTTGAAPCFFCAMLASRGPVYDDDSFEDSDPRFQGPGDQKVHDGCGCMLLPMYRRAGEKWPGRAKEFEALWRANPSLIEFRRAYEGRKP